MALIYSIVVRHMKGDDFIAYFTDKVDIFLSQKVVCVKADTEIGVRGDELENIGGIAAEAGTGEIFHGDHAALFLCVFGKGKQALLRR